MYCTDVDSLSTIQNNANYHYKKKNLTAENKET